LHEPTFVPFFDELGVLAPTRRLLRNERLCYALEDIPTKKEKIRSVSLSLRRRGPLGGDAEDGAKAGAGFLLGLRAVV